MSKTKEKKKESYSIQEQNYDAFIKPDSYLVDYYCKMQLPVLWKKETMYNIEVFYYDDLNQDVLKITMDIPRTTVFHNFPLKYFVINKTDGMLSFKLKLKFDIKSTSKNEILKDQFDKVFEVSEFGIHYSISFYHGNEYNTFFGNNN